MPVITTFGIQLDPYIKPFTLDFPNQRPIVLLGKPGAGMHTLAKVLSYCTDFRATSPAQYPGMQAPMCFTQGVDASQEDPPHTLYQALTGKTGFELEPPAKGEKQLWLLLHKLFSRGPLRLTQEDFLHLPQSWIAGVFELLRNRQIFLDNPPTDVLNTLTWTDEEDVRTSFILCSKHSEQNTYRNPTPEEAGAFYRAYDVGFQHVSGILQSKGWRT